MKYLAKDMDPIVVLAPLGSWPASVHEFDLDSIWAINAALAARRPLLVRGEPGTGKSQLARAAAQALGRLFLARVVNARTESEDLQFHYDAIHRLAEAQTAGLGAHQTAVSSGDRASEAQTDSSTGNSSRINENLLLANLQPRFFLSPGPLWWAFDWRSALVQDEISRLGRTKPDEPQEWQPEKGCVILIDEIDKAEADLPNGLLETLGNGGFSVPLTGQSVAVPADLHPPLVIITTNEDRELPPAFIRRCLVLHFDVPDEEDLFTERLMHRGWIHFGKACPEKVRKLAAELLWRDRQEARRQGLPAPGQAEYLDLLRALVGLKEIGESQEEALKEIAKFALKKQPRGSVR